MLSFHIFNTETIDRSIVSYYLTGNVTVSRNFNAVSGLDECFIFIRNTRTSSSISENSVNSQCLGDNKLAIPSYPVNKYIILTGCLNKDK